VLNTRHISLGIAFIGALLIAACSSQNNAKEAKLCTAGNYVYCRCEDRSEGTKLCQDDGASFAACVCDGSQPPPTDGDYNPGGNDTDGGLESVPPTPPPPPGAPQIDAACKDKLGVVAGDAADSYTYVMGYKGDGTWDVAKGHPGIRSAATVIPVGSSLVATYQGTFSAILWTKMTGTSWSAPFSVGSASAASAPSSVAFAGGLKMFYLGTDDHYHMGTYGASGWDDATALGEPSTGTSAIPGKSAPTAAAISTSVVLAFTGNDGSMSRTTYSSSSFSTLGKFSGVTAYEAQPSMTALDTGGANDLLMVYTGGDSVLRWVGRSASSHTWNSPTIVDASAVTASTPTETSLVAMPGGKAMLLFRGTNNQPYFSIWDPASGFAAPAELASGTNPELASAPVATRGHCGSDVTVAYAKKDGGVEIMRYGSGAWKGPFKVDGITKATYVGVGEIP
jgi:hypothetical protein